MSYVYGYDRHEPFSFSFIFTLMCTYTVHVLLKISNMLITLPLIIWIKVIKQFLTNSYNILPIMKYQYTIIYVYVHLSNTFCRMVSIIEWFYISGYTHPSDHYTKNCQWTDFNIPEYVFTMSRLMYLYQIEICILINFNQ